jgi:hypothetical protein
VLDVHLLNNKSENAMCYNARMLVPMINNKQTRTIMKTATERAGDRHNALVAQLAKEQDKFNKQVDALVKRRLKMLALIRAVTRSSKRLRKLHELAPVNAGPVQVAAPPKADRGATVPPPPSSATTTTTDDGLDIPAPFRRVPNAADDAARAEIAAQQAERKTAKARGRVAKLKANQSGERRKMPLSGKDALDLINAG